MRDAVGRLAAKFSTGGEIHPLICHMVDVAAVAEAVWRDCLADRARAFVAASFQLEEGPASRWLAFLAGGHDLGKATPVFQAKGSADKRSTPAWLIDTDLGFGQLGTQKDPGHGAVTAAYLPSILASELQVPFATAERLSVITGGHHGIFPSARKRAMARTPTSLGEPRREEPNPWEDARRELTLALAGLLDVGGTPAPLGNAASMLLAGFISVVDWIGSIDDERFFPYAPIGPADLDIYLSERRERAGSAVTQLLWDAWPAPSLPASFGAAFPQIAKPRHLQLQVQQAVPAATVPGLAVLEAPMGEGKTEAAFYLADYWNASGLRGSYVAMPTQATSNQLHDRFQTFLEERYDSAEKINLQLLHGHAALRDATKLLTADESIPPPSGVDAGEVSAGEASVGAAEWFTYRKRGLLAPFGVGTIDQALLSVLQVRHGFVRLFGLASKTIIIDEVHAYDTYMSTLLERLLEWLAALGSPVVLLSATLPSARRKGLVSAYLRGLGHNVSALPATLEKYPRMTLADSGGVRESHVEASPETRRDLGIRWLDCGLEGLPDVLLAALDDGGCAAVVCNTVARAQEVYVTLRDAISGYPEAWRPELDLFHARFLFKDRQGREERCLRRFGKPDQSDRTTADRPRRAILVATQVIEQSLDLDFDLMVSELAPVDLLLQRSGRLHRHERADRRGQSRPILQVLASPLDDQALPEFDRATTAVYDEHVLLRTWLALQGRDSVAIPDDVEGLIDEVYRESGAPPANATEALTDRWAFTFEAMEKKREREREEAMLRRIPTPVSNARLEDHTRDPREEDEPELHPALQAVTRMTEPSVQVALLPPDSPLLQIAADAPSRAQCREVLEHSVSITAQDVVRELLARPVPTAWRRSGLLRRMRVLSMDDSNTCQLERVTLQYDAELGLRIVRP